jgi:hypothetical protein
MQKKMKGQIHEQMRNQMSSGTDKSTNRQQKPTLKWKNNRSNEQTAMKRNGEKRRKKLRII